MSSFPAGGAGAASIGVDPADLALAAQTAAGAARLLREAVPVLVASWTAAASGLGPTETGRTLDACAATAHRRWAGCAEGIEALAGALRAAAGHYRDADAHAVPAQRVPSPVPGRVLPR